MSFVAPLRMTRNWIGWTLPHWVTLMTISSRTPEGNPRSLHIFRGVRSAILGAVAGALLTFVLAYGFLAVRWVLMGARQSDREWELSRAFDELPNAFVACTVLCACAGWACRAPKGDYRFAQTLVVLFVSTFCLWIVIGLPLGWILDVYAPMSKQGVPPIRKYVGWPVFVGVPLLATCVLTRKRMRSQSNDAHPMIPTT
jgi:hypothetical protein